MRLKHVYNAVGVRIMSTLILISRWVPRRAALAAGERFGDMIHFLARHHGFSAKRRESTGRRTFVDLSLDRCLEDLSQALGGSCTRAERQRIARNAFRNAGRSLAQTLMMPRMSPEEILSLIDADSFEPVERVLNRGKGLLILTPHLGAWEFLASYLVLRLDRPFSAVAQRQRYGPYDELFDSVRRLGAGMEVIYQDSGVRPILTALRRNRPVGILGDTDIPRLNSLLVPFFGRPARTPVGPAALARSTGAGMVPIFIRWKPGEGHSPVLSRHHVHVLPEIELVRTPDKKADLLENTKRWTGVVEGIVREYPDQWIWFHRRWDLEMGKRGER